MITFWKLGFPICQTRNSLFFLPLGLFKIKRKWTIKWFEFKAGFLNLSTADILGWIILCCMNCPTHSRMFNSTPCVYPLDASGTVLLLQLWQPEMTPDTKKCVLEKNKTEQNKNKPMVENHWLKVKILILYSGIKKSIISKYDQGYKNRNILAVTI